MRRHLKGIMMSLLALLAIGSGAASAASAAPHWTKAEQALTGTAALSESVQVMKVGNQTGAAVQLNLSSYWHVNCSSLRLVGASAIETPGSASVERVSLSGCKVLTVSEMPTQCVVESFGAPEGQINTVALKGELKTIGSSTYLILRPATGETVTEIRMSDGVRSCATSGAYALTGSIALKVPVNVKDESVLVAESFNESVPGYGLLLGLKEVRFNAKLGFALAGGSTWGVGL